MFMLITPDKYDHFAPQLESMFALRYRVFTDRLGWVKGQNGIERDDYDDLSPTYVIHQQEDDEVTACVRLLPTTGRNMLRDSFPQLLDGADAPEGQELWESSRFAVDTNALKKKAKTP